MANAQPHPTILLREQIVTAALALVQETGLASVTMRNLARRLGYSPASLYMHFRGKDELLRAVAAETAGGLLERVRAAAEQASPRAALNGVACAFLQFASESSSLDRLIFDETPGSPFGSEEEALRDELFGVLRAIVKRASDAGAIEAPELELATAVAWAELRGLARLVRPEGPDPAAARAAANRGPDRLAGEWSDRWVRAS